ncbi:MAG TPA: hypothetical protein VLJ37_12815 [bacterium]|nr:hypothetical protein [bacterium]
MAADDRETRGIFIRVALAALLLPSLSGADPKKEIRLYGRIAQVINQHLIEASKKESVYIDLEDGGDQIVAYVPHSLSCRGRVELTGKWIEVRGPTKRPGRETKVDDSYVERQMDVTRWRCLDLDDENVAALIDRLADPKASLEQKEAVKRRILDQGRDAVPVLIDHLGDARVFKRQDIQNYYNLPPNLPTPPPVMANVTVGQECERILYDLITPNPSPSAGTVKGKPFSFSVLRVTDWKAWWEKNKGKGLEEIHQDLQPLVDRYWREHGTEQVVP